MAEFLDLESQDAIRMPFNVIPGTKQLSLDIPIPISVIYTPLKSFPNLPIFPYSPLRCRSCRSILNPFSTVDYAANIWICAFCFARNPFPPHYGELFPQYTTVEYEPPPPEIASGFPVYLFVVDTCMIEVEMGFLKSALSKAFDLVPDEGFIGLITFGTSVYVHELGFSGGSGIPKSYVFKGCKEVTRDKVLDHLNFSAGKKRKPVNGGSNGVSSDNSSSRFLLPASQCGFELNSLLEELQKDPWNVPTDKRASRCTGVALSIAAHLLGACFPGVAARILAFVGGPSTEGPGAIVSKKLSEPIRFHKDLDKGSAPHFRKAVKFYEGLSKQLVHQGHVLDLFACAVDQVGVAELRVAVERTGGFVVMGESFGHSEFKDSLQRVFQSGEYENDLGTSSNGIFEVSCSKEMKIQGILGPCASLDKRGLNCSETVIGQGNTTTWKMCSLDRSTSLNIYFDILKKESPETTDQFTSNQFYLQFSTYYQHKGGRMRLRVTTLSRRWVSGPGSLQELIAGFDQDAAAVTMARLASFKMEVEAEFDPIRWIDMSLILLCSKFGNYQKGNASSFSLPPQLSRFPQLIFHLRRSQYIEVFNYSPDETAFFRMILNRENVTNALLMIQPSLVSYSLNSHPEQVPLDASAVASDRILLLDSYFSVVVFHGASIAQWRKSGYQDMPDHQAFSQLLQTPRDAADALIKHRLPVPRLVICDQHGSQARFLMAKLNPSVTNNSDAPLILTDDVGFDAFLDHLQRLAVQ